MFISRSNRAAVKALAGGFGLLGCAPCSLEEIRQLLDELLLLCTVRTYRTQKEKQDSPKH